VKLVKLLLTETVDNLGIVGDVVTVRPGYARNFLLPRGYATTPTEGNIKRLAERRAKVEAELKARHAELEQTLEKLKSYEMTIQRSANEQGVLFGGVSQHDIAEHLRTDGFPVEDRMVRLGQIIKRLDTYHIPIVLAQDLKTEIKLWVVRDGVLPDAEEEEAEGEIEAEEVAEEKPKKPRKSKKADEEAAA